MGNCYACDSVNKRECRVICEVRFASSAVHSYLATANAFDLTPSQQETFMCRPLIQVKRAVRLFQRNRASMTPNTVKLIDRALAEILEVLAYSVGVAPATLSEIELSAQAQVFVICPDEMLEALGRTRHELVARTRVFFSERTL